MIAGAGGGWLCRDCLATGPADAAPSRCPKCRGPRVLAHDALFALTIAHVDCDAFYAAVEKRDNPDLADKPVIIGGGRRGVVSTACYIARISGVKSAMPMFKALKLCPDAVVVKPDMARYVEAGRAIRAMMRDLTPLVEPLSLDEAFLDLTGAERLHGAPAAVTLARLIARIESQVGVTASVGLSYCKFLAKVASDLEKPRGFSVIGRAEAMDFLADKPVSIIWGVGAALGGRLERDGLRRVRDLRRLDLAALTARYGAMGRRLHDFARGDDDRRVNPDRETRSVSAETTFNDDISALDRLEPLLWRLCERVAARSRGAALAGRTVTLKLKTADFRSRTRARRLTQPSRSAAEIYAIARDLLGAEVKGEAFRLIGVGVSDLVEDARLAADAAPLLPGLGGESPALERARRAETAIEAVRAKFGAPSIDKGLGLRDRPATGARDRPGPQQPGSGDSDSDTRSPRATKSP